MTELQLQIRRLAHKASALKKRGKDTTEVLKLLGDLRAARKDERTGTLPADPATPTDTGAPVNG